MERKYIAPNAITAANMFLGYLSIIASIAGDYQKAVYFIIIAMFCDGLDGKTARKLDAFSEFGKEFDSFCDAISFGLAPGILVFSKLSEIKSVENFAIAISFVYALCGVMRLVKFNIVTTASSEKDDFSGMPIPSAAAVVCSYILFVEAMKPVVGRNIFSAEVFMLLTLVSGVLMVSTIPFKTPDKLLKFIPNKLMIPFVIIVIVTLKYSLFILTAYYVMTNIIHFILDRKKKVDEEEFEEKEIEESIETEEIDTK